MIRKDDLIRHCERMTDRYKFISNNLYFEHKILLKLLTGKNVNEIFDKNDEYIDDGAVFVNTNLED